jgi:hypothetical protein
MAPPLPNSAHGDQLISAKTRGIARFLSDLAAGFEPPHFRMRSAGGRSSPETLLGNEGRHSTFNRDASQPVRLQRVTYEVGGSRTGASSWDRLLRCSGSSGNRGLAFGVQVFSPASSRRSSNSVKRNPRQLSAARMPGRVTAKTDQPGFVRVLH